MASALPLRRLANAPVEVEDPPAAARAAGLRHVDDSQPGLRRRRTGNKLRLGERWVEQFQILDARGRVVRAIAQVARRLGNTPSV